MNDPREQETERLFRSLLGLYFVLAGAQVCLWVTWGEAEPWRNFDWPVIVGLTSMLVGNTLMPLGGYRSVLTDFRRHPILGLCVVAMSAGTGLLALVVDIANGVHSMAITPGCETELSNLLNPEVCP